jgi:preprotein translocase subunit SecG
METLIASIHVLVALILILLVLIQDSKGGGMGGAFGGGGSNSVFGATGAATLAQKLTRWTAVVFAVTSIWLTILSTQSGKSVFENRTVPAAAAPAAESTAAPATDAAAPAADGAAPSTTAPVTQ